MSLPTLFAGKSAPGLSAALDLRFALDKSLTAYRGPTPSFSRASTGSYFDGSGVLRYAAVNILTYSEDLTTAAWVNQNTTDSGNATISPDGKTTADSLIESATNSSHLIYQQANVTSGTIYTFSVYLKANQRSFSYIQMADSSSPNKRFSALINISNGTIVTTRSLNSPTNTSSSISDAGNGWYRASITMSQSGGSIIYAQVAISDSSTPTYDAADLPTYSGNISNGIFIWGAQLEASSTVGTYCPTTSSANSAPRFNHTFNGTSWVSRGLLLEEQRTNLSQRSEDFSHTYYTKFDSSISANQIAAPDGATTADKLVENTANAIHYFSSSGYMTTNQTYTVSIFAKAAERNWVKVFIWNGVSSLGAWFNLSSGTIGTTESGITSSIQNVGNGWYRCSITRAVSSGLIENGSGVMLATAGNSVTYTGDGSSGVYVWGNQVEAGSFSTSYIGTTSSSVTRSADVCQITGSDFSGFWNGTESSIAFEADVIGNNSGNGNQFVFGASLSSSAANNQIALIRNLNNLGGDYGLFVNNGGTPQVQTSRAAGSWAIGLTVKAAAAYKLNDFADVLNGGAAITDTSGTIPTVDQLSIGNFFSGGGPLNGHIARLRYYRKRLPNATLQQLST